MIDLVEGGGRLNRAAVGWSARPRVRANLSGHPLRKKRWDFWCLTTETCLLQVCYADVDYLGLAVVTFLEYASGRRVEKVVPVPFAPGFALPETVRGGDMGFRGLGLRLELRESEGSTIIRASCRGLEADLSVARAGDSINVVVPFAGGLFHYTSKHAGLPVRGSVRALGRTHSFDGGFAVLDFGRGVSPYRAAWRWAAGGGRQDGRAVGINLGAIWTDGSGVNENGVVVDGRAHPLGDVVFAGDRISGPDVDLRFRPIRGIL